MRHGRNVPVDQSQKKPEIRKDKERGEYHQWWRFDGLKEDKNTNPVFLADDVVNDLKQMNPRQIVEFLLNNRQPRPQGLLAFQYGGGMRRSAILKVVEEKTLGTRLNNR